MENFVLIGVFVLLGMLFQRLKSFPKDTAQVLNMFAIYVSMPALVLLKVPLIAFSVWRGLRADKAAKDVFREV